MKSLYLERSLVLVLVVSWENLVRPLVRLRLHLHKPRYCAPTVPLIVQSTAMFADSPESDRFVSPNAATQTIGLLLHQDV